MGRRRRGECRHASDFARSRRPARASAVGSGAHARRSRRSTRPAAECPLMKTVLTIAIVLVVVSLAACGFLRSAENRMLYQRTPESNPPGRDAFWLQRDEAVRLKIWRLHPDARAALVYFGGNAEDVAHNLPV